MESEGLSNITKINIEEKMRSAYLEYAMSVIVGRALPDVRDGLKPVHRRILYAMHSMHIAYNKPFMKSARVVGEVIGKYHPHGDSAVYDAIVRLVQTFSMRAPLINGQGNFGSVDGDSAAAMRYTEVRLQKISQELLADLEKDTVDFTANYDGSLSEPSVLPSKIPNLLLNGATGIAVGMATNIPPHNLAELVDGLIYLIDEKENVTFEGLVDIIKGPDFPTGGMILGKKGILEAYSTGRGIVSVRATARFEPIKGSNSREAIIIDELPYMVNKANQIEKIAGLVRDKKIEGIQDIRDESDRKGMRIVIELKKGEIPETVLMQLYKHTAFQSSFGIIMLAVVNGRPRVLPLIEVLKLFIDHRIEIITKRTRYDLKKAQERAHVLEGLKIALDNIDDVIEIIRGSASSSEAKENLIKRYSLSMIQAQSILEMRLQRLTGLERGKLVAELEELLEKIDELKKILFDEELVFSIIKTELLEIKNEYKTDRRSQLVPDPGSINEEDLIPVEEMVVSQTQGGYIKRCQLEVYRSQNRGGKGKIGMTVKEEDNIEQMLIASTHSTLLLFSNKGKVYWKKVYSLPLTSRTGKGRATVNILPLEEGEKICAFLPVNEFSEDLYTIMITKKGIIKKTSLMEYSNQRSKGSKAIVVDDGDELITAKLCRDEDLVFMATRLGMSLKIEANSLRAQGRVTRGCRGITLSEKELGIDEVVSMEVVDEERNLLTVTENGFGKKSPAKTYRLGSRGNKGVMNLKSSNRNGKVVSTISIDKGDELLLMTYGGKVIRLNSDQIRQTNRVTQGVRLIDLNKKEKVVSVAKVVNEITDDVEEDKV